MIVRCWRTVRAGFRIAALLFCTGTFAWAQPAGTLTLADGKTALIRGATVYAVSEGIKVREGDMLHTDAKGQAQIEFQGGTILNLGPGTRALLLRLPQGRGEAEVAVLSGWVKFAHKKSGTGASLRLHAPTAQLATEDATAVLHTGAGVAEIFVESGAAKLTELGKKAAPGSTRAVRGGEFIVRTGDQPAVTSPRPTAQFIGSMPRHFKDNLPVRIGRFKDKQSEPKRDHDVAYAEVEAWLRAGPPVRKNFVKRFQARAREGDFRKGLIDNLREHPEWDPVLFPEKYLPKPEKSQ